MEDFKDQVGKGYQEKTGITPEFYVVDIGSGSRTALLIPVEKDAEHQTDLAGYRVFESADVQAGQLLDLVQTVYQGIPMHIEFSGGLGDAEAAVKKV